MQQSIMMKFTDVVISEAAKRYGICRSDLILLGTNQSFVFGYSLEENHYVLRITHGSHRSKDLIQAELDWINYLAINGVRVSRPIYSVKGEFIESFIDNGGEEFFFVVFERAPGSPWTEEISQNEEFLRLGKVLGQIHCLSKAYVPEVSAPKRFVWNANAYLRDFPLNVPASQELVHLNFENLMQRVRQVPYDGQSYGLIHGDFCFGNYAVQSDGTITVFDFDESQYGWLIQDIAVNLFYGIAVPSSDEDELTFTQRYLTCFFEGYDRENALGRECLTHLSTFLDLRQAILYSSLYRNGNLDKLDEWSKEFLRRARTNMENQLPLVDMNRLHL